jgi:hypothetical protein
MHPSLNEAEISSIVEAGGGRFIGLLKEAPGKSEAFVLFISPKTKSTLAISISQLTVEAVRKQLAESNAAFSTGSIAEETHCTGRLKNNKSREMGLSGIGCHCGD